MPFSPDRAPAFGGGTIRGLDAGLRPASRPRTKNDACLYSVKTGIKNILNTIIKTQDQHQLCISGYSDKVSGHPAIHHT